MQWSIGAMLREAACSLCVGLALAGGGCATTQATSLPSDSCTSWAATSSGHSNAGSIGLGCANALNLKNMVADPNDLKIGKALGSADGAREALAVEAYKQGKVKELKQSGSSNTIAIPLGDTK